FCLRSRWRRTNGARTSGPPCRRTPRRMLHPSVQAATYVSSACLLPRSCRAGLSGPPAALKGRPTSSLLLGRRSFSRRRGCGRRSPLQIFVHSLEKHVGRPRTRGCTPARVVVERRLAGLDLIECLTALDAVLHTVADDRHHIAILEQVGFICQA